MVYLKVILGFIFICVGWVYLFHPNLIIALNALIRDALFNDRQILLARKKLAVAYFCIGLILLYAGITSMALYYSELNGTRDFIDRIDYSMYIATQDYYAGRYDAALQRYKNVLPYTKEKDQVLRCMVSAYTALGDKERAKALLEKLLIINPQDAVAKMKLNALKKQ